MPAFIESRRHTLILIAASLTVLLAMFTAWTLLHEHTLARYPVHAFTLLLAPVLLAGLLRLIRPSIARVALLSAPLLYAAWLVGFAGLGASGLLLLASLALGGWLGRFGGIGRERAGLMDALLAVTLGLAVLGVLLTFLAHYKVNNASFYATGLLTVTLLGWRSTGRYLASFQAWLWEESKPGLALWVAAGLFTGLALLHIAWSSLTGFNADTTTLHLYVPSYMSAYGDWSYDVQKYLWGVEPMAGDFLFGVVYMLSDARGPQFFNVVVSLLTAGLIYAACRPRAGTLNALLGATAWLAMSYLLSISQSLHVESLLSLFVFAAFVYLLDGNTDESRPWQTGLTAGLLAAAAVAVKLTGWVFTPVYLALVFGMLGPRHGWKWATRAAATAALIMLVFGGYQYWYALIMTGDPVFFYYNGIFQSPYDVAQNFVDSHWTGHYDWNLPIALSFHTERFAETGPGSMGFQWLLFLPAALLLSVFRGSGRARWFGFAGLFYAAVVLAPEQYLRYALPAFPFLAVFITETCAQPGRLMQTIYRTGMFAVIGVNTLAVQNSLHRYHDLPTEIIYHADARDQYMRDIAPTILANRIINALEPGPVNVLYISMPGGAELRGTAYYQNWYNPTLSDAFSRVQSADDVGAIVAANDIRYVILNPSFDRARKLVQVWAYCQNHGQQLARIGAVYLYRLDREASYTHDAVANPQLADDAKGWKFDGGAARRWRRGPGYVLGKNMSISQPLEPVAIARDQPFHFGATVNCLVAKGVIRAEIEWDLGSGMHKVGMTNYYCVQAGPMTISETFTAPEDVRRGIARITLSGDGFAAVSEISVRY